MPARPASSKKTVPLVRMLVTLGLVGGIAASAVQFYRHPTETFNSLLRTRMLLAGRVKRDVMLMGWRCAIFAPGNVVHRWC